MQSSSLTVETVHGIVGRRRRGGVDFIETATALDVAGVETVRSLLDREHRPGAIRDWLVGEAVAGSGQRREALMTLAASDYDTLRELTSAASPETIEAERLWRRVRALRKRGVGEAALSQAIAAIGLEGVSATLRAKGPAAPSFHARAMSASGTERDHWLTLAAAPARAIRRRVGQTSSRPSYWSQMRALRKRGVSEAMIEDAIERLGRETVLGALAEQGRPLTVACIARAIASRGGAPQYWVTVGAAPASAVRRLARRTGALRVGPDRKPVSTRWVCDRLGI